MESLLSFKNWIVTILSFFWLWFEPARDSALLLIFLIVVDAVTDVWVRIEAKEKLQIKQYLIKLVKDLTAFLIYILAIHYFQVAYLKQTFAIFQILAGIPIIACLTGIIENVEKLTGISVAIRAKNILSQLFESISKKALPKDDDVNSNTHN